MTTGTQLSAGPLSCVYENGELFDIRLNGELVLLRLNAPFRDENWATTPAKISDETIEQDENGFRVTFQAEVVSDPIDFAWRGEIVGTTGEWITFVFMGKARSTFLRNRIGFCLLHPCDAAGDTLIARRSDRPGPIESTFPETIVPDQPVEPFTNLTALAHRLPSGDDFGVLFTGEKFEMEDQRNWTDASFKTFCTPLRHPFPVTIEAGAVIYQSVSLLGRGARSAETEPSDRTRPLKGVSPLRGSEVAPRLISTESSPVQNPVAERHREAEPPSSFGGKQLKTPISIPGLLLPNTLPASHPLLPAPSFLRVDVLVGSARAGERIAAAGEIATRFALPLEVALLLEPGDSVATLDSLARLVRGISMVRILALPATQTVKVAPDYGSLVDRAWRSFGRFGAPILTGTDSDFFFVNRFPPPESVADGLVFSANPQVHAVDDRSIDETISTYPALLSTARQISGGKFVAVSPLSLSRRWNPYSATKPDREFVWPPDHRENLKFGQDWYERAVAALFSAGADSVTAASP